MGVEGKDVKDDRFDVLSIDSLYCDIDKINTKSLETLTRFKYCLLHFKFNQVCNVCI